MKKSAVKQGLVTILGTTGLALLLQSSFSSASENKEDVERLPDFDVTKFSETARINSDSNEVRTATINWQEIIELGDSPHFSGHVNLLPEHYLKKVEVFFR